MWRWLFLLIGQRWPKMWFLSVSAEEQNNETLQDAEENQWDHQTPVHPPLLPVALSLPLRIHVTFISTPRGCYLITHESLLSCSVVPSIWPFYFASWCCQHARLYLHHTYANSELQRFSLFLSHDSSNVCKVRKCIRDGRFQRDWPRF